MVDVVKRGLSWMPRLLNVIGVVVLIVAALLAGALVLSIVQHPAEVGAQWKLGVAIFTSGLVWLVTDRLARLIGVVVEGDAFAPASARYLRHIGLILVIVQLLPFVGLLLPTDAPDWLRSGQIDVGNTLAIVVIMILSEAFRQGAALRDDVIHTV